MDRHENTRNTRETKEQIAWDIGIIYIIYLYMCCTEYCAKNKIPSTTNITIDLASIVELMKDVVPMRDLELDSI